MQASSPKIIVLDGKDYDFYRPKLKKWLGLEDRREKVQKASKSWDSDVIAKSICSYVHFALMPEEDVNNMPWLDVIYAMREIGGECELKYDFPFLRVEIEEKKEAWDYEGRTWYIWLYIIAKEFGWTSEYVADLDIDDAIALVQEIAVNSQIEKEFQWAISEVPYQTKDGFKPLDRPKWMLYNTQASPAHKIKIRKEFMPVGKIVRFDDKDAELKERDTTL
jgi:hypothetical protein